jgi:subtilisin family serine protease
MVSDHQTNHPFEAAVANLSFGGDGIDPLLDDAVMRAVQAGITVVTSAGNHMRDACQVSPAHLGDPTTYPTPNNASVITVGATQHNDLMAPYSNYGVCVDVLAPGTDVYAQSPEGYWFVRAGTSFAAPHVAGVAALHMQKYGLYNSPASIEGIIKDAATQHAITGLSPGTPNLMLNSSVPRRRPCCS